MSGEWPGGSASEYKIKSSPGDVSLKTMLDEIAKLETIRSFALLAELLRDVAVKVVDEWVTGALIESPSHMVRRSEPLRMAMLAALLVHGQQRITDQLVRLRISTVRRIGLQATRCARRGLPARQVEVGEWIGALVEHADGAPSGRRARSPPRVPCPRSGSSSRSWPPARSC